VTALELEPAGPVVARLQAPSSKSVTNRMLVCAALADGTSLLRQPLASDDSAAMRTALGQLGARVDDVDDVDDTGEAGAAPGGPPAAASGGRSGAAAWRVTGTAGRLRSPEEPLDARESGTTMRFLAAVATLAPDPVRLTGRPGLLARPVGPLLDALRQLGAAIDGHGGFPPVTAAGGGLDGGDAGVDAGASSQFASAVLLAAPFARRTVTLRAERLAAPDYVELTGQVMRGFGAEVERLGRSSWRVGAGVSYRATGAEVEHDASAAAHLFALAAATGGSVTLTNAEAGSLQPDAALPALLEAMGATVTREGPALTVSGPEALTPVDADLGAMPDQVTTVAALAALAGGRSRLRNVAVARGHETDRLHALATELAGLGVGVEELPDGLVIDGGGAHGPATVHTRGDHRLAMAFAAVAARVPGVRIEDPGCVAKTYPGFWDDLARAGLRWRTIIGAT
jgi:3-phosphoshikimate 1-carboxyvinyltransferase